jgi:hypothetical protein
MKGQLRLVGISYTVYGQFHDVLELTFQHLIPVQQPFVGVSMGTVTLSVNKDHEFARLKLGDMLDLNLEVKP